MTGRRARFLPAFLSLVLAFIIAGVWTVSVSASSLPGEAFYPLKLATEEIRLALTFRHEARAELHMAFAERRLIEMQTLIVEQGRVEESLLEALTTETGLALAEIEEMAADQRADVAAKLLTSTKRQRVVLAWAQQYAPQAAQAGLSQALETSRHKHEQAMGILGITPEPSRQPTHTPHATSTATPTDTPAETPTAMCHVAAIRLHLPQSWHHNMLCFISSKHTIHCIVLTICCNI